MISPNKENEFDYASLLCLVPNLNSDEISPSQVFHNDEVPPSTTKILHLTTNITFLLINLFNHNIVDSRLVLLIKQQQQRFSQTTT